MARNDSVEEGLPDIFFDYWSSSIVLLKAVWRIDRCEPCCGLSRCLFYDSSSGLQEMYYESLHYLETPPKAIFKINRRMGSISEEREEVKEKIVQKLNELQDKLQEKLLIVYDYDSDLAMIHDKFGEIKKLEFFALYSTPFSKNNLYVIELPRSNKVRNDLEYMKTDRLEIYNYNIRFDKEIIRFRTFSIGDRVEIIQIPDESVSAIIKAKDGINFEKRIYLEPRRLYMFSHSRRG